MFVTNADKFFCNSTILANKRRLYALRVASRGDKHGVKDYRLHIEIVNVYPRANRRESLICLSA